MTRIKIQVLQSFVQKGGLDVLRPILVDKKNGIQEVGRPTLNVQTHTHIHNSRSNIQVLPATQSTWSIYKKERSEVAASMALPGSLEIVRLGAQSGDLEFALDVIREFAWKNEDLTQIFIENDGVETILDLIRESEDRSIRFKACDTLGKLASKNDSVRNTIEGAGMEGIVESMSMKY